MTDSEVIHYSMQMMVIVFLLSMPPIIVAAVVGVLVSIVQAVTHIQEQTLSFSIKLTAVSFTIALMAGWAGAQLYNYAMQVFLAIPFAR